MSYSEAAKSCLERKDYSGYLENSRKQYAHTGTTEDKREMLKAEKTYSMYKEIQEFLRRENSDHYEVLGVQKSATQEEIRRAFNALMIKFHPDVNKIDGSNAVAGTIQKAYSVLGNPDKRKKYDMQRREGVFRGHGFAPHSANDVMAHPFFATFYSQSYQSPFVYTGQDLYEQLYAQMNREFRRRDPGPPREVDTGRLIFVVVVVLLFLLL